MTRAACTLVVFLALAAWTGAQGPPPPLPVDVQLRMHRENRVLLNDMVRQGLALAEKDDPVGRAEECERTVRALAAALRRAAEAQNADRAAELGDHLDAVVRDGLIPNIDEANRTVDPASPEYARLTAVRARAAGGLDELRTDLPTAGKVGDNGRVKDLRGKLDTYRDKIKEK
ncbi:MAG: hypothetical protein K2P78_09440 [Gemmataceae bacterium]|nr:hypothetical protein [Gemmataceae bacterium]